MARETKYGLGLIALLCVGLVGAVAWRVSREMGRQPAAGREAEVAGVSPKQPQEPPKLLLKSAEGERGDTAPPTASAPSLEKSDFAKSNITKGDSWTRAQLASADEPVAMPARRRYPLMPAETAPDTKPSLAPDETPPSTAAMPHTSFRPEDSDSPATPTPRAKPLAADPLPAPRQNLLRTAPEPTAAANPRRETITVAAEQPIGRPRYAEPDFAAPAPAPTPVPVAAEPPANYPPAAQRAWPRPEAGAPIQRNFAPARAPLAASPDRGDGTTAVRPNDTFWTISERTYGTGAYFKALIRHNADQHPQPDRLAVGDTVLVPPVAELAQKYPQLCPKPRRVGEGDIRNAAAPMSAAGGRSYEVREGDTLFDIARFELGDGARWVEIYQLNRDQLTDDFHYVKPGSTLILPGRRQSADRVAKEPTPSRIR